MEEIRLAGGAVEITLLPEVGARWHRLRAFGHDLLRTPDRPEEHLRDPFFWGGYIMAPWCNRIGATPAAVGSRRIDLAPNFPDGTAIHGQVFARRWESMPDGSLRVLAGDDGWPWPYEVTQRVGVAEASIGIELALTNRSDDPMPAGIGLHPWFRRPLLVAIRGERAQPIVDAAEPRPQPVAGRLDLRVLGEPAPDLDATWSDLAREPVELLWPELGVRARMRITAPAPYVVAATPRDLGAIAIEPQTHAPLGLRRLLNGEPGGLTLIAPSSTLTLGVELVFEQVRRGAG